MKTLKEISGLEIHNCYIKQQKVIYGKDDYRHFLNCNKEWLEKLKTQLKENGEVVSVGLNKINYLGKKTRALLEALEIKEPKTLKELKKLIKL